MDFVGQCIVFTCSHGLPSSVGSGPSLTSAAWVTAKGPSGSEAMRGLKDEDSKDETQGVCGCMYVSS